VTNKNKSRAKKDSEQMEETTTKSEEKIGRLKVFLHVPEPGYPSSGCFGGYAVSLDGVTEAEYKAFFKMAAQRKAQIVLLNKDQGDIVQTIVPLSFVKKCAIQITLLPLVVREAPSGS
jgi:hypothetical protein